MKKLKDLLVGVADTDVDVDVTGISVRAQKTEPGNLFVCLKGSEYDGHDFALNAQMLGAAAIVSERKTECSLPEIIVPDARRAYAIISKNYFDNASDKLKIVAVTGTNGKTSTVEILSKMLEEAGVTVGTIGTLGARYAGKTVKTDMTTPDPYDMHRLFAKMQKAGVETVVMEVSAHAICLEKMSGVVSDVAIFTNVTPDHLDYFKDMKTYADVKKSYFSKKTTKFAVLNADDVTGRELIEEADVPSVSYGLENPSDVFAINVEHTDEGTSFVVNLFDDVFKVKTHLHGLHNVRNVLAAMTAAKVLGVKKECMLAALDKLESISGRFEIVVSGGAKIVVDFAHTPDGLKNLLESARELCTGRLWAIFGCGGDRDRTKRPVMGQIASELADIIVLTSDNPRSEQPPKIIEEILAGADPEKCVMTTDRRAAIDFVLENLAPGDVAVFAGKGAENYMEIAGVKHPYNDMKEILQKIRSKTC